MPKQPKSSIYHRNSSASTAPLQRPMSAPAQHNNRVAAIWNARDDEILLAARAAGLNWQPIANQNFPQKTANACRKRHERLMERRRHEDWDARKLDVLAAAYMDCRKEMWSIVATKIGERWDVVESKCMEKGFRNLQAITLIPQKNAPSDDRDRQGNEDDDEGDSGICCSEAEMEAGAAGARVSPSSSLRTLQPVQPVHPVHPVRPLHHLQPAPNRQTIPQARPLLPLYQPPASAVARKPVSMSSYTEGPFGSMAFQREQHSRTPDGHSRSQRGISIQSMLSHTAPSRA